MPMMMAPAARSLATAVASCAGVYAKAGQAAVVQAEPDAHCVQGAPDEELGARVLTAVSLHHLPGDSAHGQVTVSHCSNDLFTRVR